MKLLIKMRLLISNREGHDFSRAETAPRIAAALAAGGRRTLIRVLQALILTLAVFLFVGAGPSTDARFKDLGHRMMCTCGCGQILLECNHVGCQSSDKMRDQLMAALTRGGGDGGGGSSGESDDLILQDFVQQYGPTVIAAPTATGFNKVAWIMPFVVLALGMAFAVHIVRSWKNRPTPALADGIVIPQGNELDQLRAKARKETDL
jgi:cytochrome c-type biogenesis protein CcmH/NrfF